MEEFITQLIGYRLSNASHILKLLEFMPVDYNLIKRVVTSFNNLHYDKDTNVLHSIPASRVHELRGRQKLLAFSEDQSIALTTLAASIAEQDSVLEVILDEYIRVQENRKKGQRTFKHFHEYLMFILLSENKLIQLHLKVNNIIII